MFAYGTAAMQRCTGICATGGAASTLTARGSGINANYSYDGQHWEGFTLSKRRHLIARLTLTLCATLGIIAIDSHTGARTTVVTSTAGYINGPTYTHVFNDTSGATSSAESVNRVNVDSHQRTWTQRAGKSRGWTQPRRTKRRPTGKRISNLQRRAPHKRVHKYAVEKRTGSG